MLQEAKLLFLNSLLGMYVKSVLEVLSQAALKLFQEQATCASPLQHLSQRKGRQQGQESLTCTKAE